MSDDTNTPRKKINSELNKLIETLQTEIQDFAHHVHKLDEYTSLWSKLEISEIRTSPEQWTKLRKKIKTEQKRCNRFRDSIAPKLNNINIQKVRGLQQLAVKKMSNQFSNVEKRFQKLMDLEEERNKIKQKIAKVQKKIQQQLEDGYTSQEVYEELQKYAKTHIGQQQLFKHKVLDGKNFDPTKLVKLSAADNSTLNVERLLASQTKEELLELEAELDELSSCFKDLNVLVKEQQEGIDSVQKNVNNANKYVKTSIEDLKDSNTKTTVGTLKFIGNKMLGL